MSIPIPSERLSRVYAKIPSAHVGAIEVRPIMEFDQAP
jgi:hypothetical protein